MGVECLQAPTANRSGASCRALLGPVSNSNADSARLRYRPNSAVRLR
jgi:hypothetical protein